MTKLETQRLALIASAKQLRLTIGIMPLEQERQIQWGDRQRIRDEILEIASNLEMMASRMGKAIGLEE
jgi:hypothetical protein